MCQSRIGGKVANILFEIWEVRFKFGEGRG